MSQHATVTSPDDSLRHEILIGGRHWIATDEPEALGGEDTAPTPLELLSAALAGCVVTTIRMYARRKGWELGEISAEAEVVTDVRPPRATIKLHLPPDLTDSERERLAHVARACAVHRTLEQGVAFEHVVEPAGVLS